MNLRVVNIRNNLPGRCEVRTCRAFAVAVFAVVIFLAVGGVVSAHHGRAGYSDGVSTVKGTVTAVQWKNPHVFIEYGGCVYVLGSMIVSSSSSVP